MVFRNFIRFLYLILSLFIVAIFVFGSNYYLLPLVKKVRHPLHSLLRQSGSLGHFLGILGSLMMILMLAYSIRKRFKFARNWGNLNYWLSLHIFFGIAGPVLVLFHTVFKFSGIVSISFWSMVLVVLSGIIGKYIYELIPRSLSGMELNRIELEAEEIGLTYEIRKSIPQGHIFWKELDKLENGSVNSSFINIIFFFLEPLKIRLKLIPVLKSLKRISGKEKKNLISIIKKRQLIIKKAGLLQKSLKILHYWHLVHKPFVIIMFLILIIHVYIAITMGYVWKF